MREIRILHEDAYCMVIDKPLGLSVQGGAGVKNSLDSILSEKYKPRPLLVHRLDKDTSGLILVAKNKEAARFFSAVFAARGIVTKRYLGLCSGIVEQKQGSIRLSLDVRGKGPLQKESETFFRLIACSEKKIPCSLLELELGTGRMHQIRRHLAQISYPLLGDDKYGDFSLNKKLKSAIGLKHLLLHASRLIIPPGPEFPDGLDVVSPLPDYFERSLSALGIS